MRGMWAGVDGQNAHQTDHLTLISAQTPRMVPIENSPRSPAPIEVVAVSMLVPRQWPSRCALFPSLERSLLRCSQRFFSQKLGIATAFLGRLWGPPPEGLRLKARGFQEGIDLSRGMCGYRQQIACSLTETNKLPYIRNLKVKGLALLGTAELFF